MVAAIMVFARRGLMPPETFRGTMSLLLVALVADVLFLWLGYFTIFRTRQTLGAGAAENEERALRRMNYLVTLLMPYLLTVFHVYIGLSTAKILPASGKIVALAIVSWIVLASLGVTALFRAARRRAVAMESEGVVGDSTIDDCWKWGIVYYNPDDPAFIVPKRIGFGWDMNFGNRWSWVLAVSLLALPIVIRFFWFM
jgi:uncharacterized membrane protein